MPLPSPLYRLRLPEHLVHVPGAQPQRRGQIAEELAAAVPGRGAVPGISDPPAGGRHCSVLVRARLGDEIAGGGWRIVEDTQVTRGGCRVETASNQIDATAETRWQRIAAALGLDDTWLL